MPLLRAVGVPLCRLRSRDVSDLGLSTTGRAMVWSELTHQREGIEGHDPPELRLGNVKIKRTGESKAISGQSSSFQDPTV